MCDVIGKPIHQPDGTFQWETECRRGVAPWECPLVLVDMWRPKDGFERRFEIQRRDDYEREEINREKDREREGENSQGRTTYPLARLEPFRVVPPLNFMSLHKLADVLGYVSFLMDKKGTLVCIRKVLHSTASIARLGSFPPDWPV